MDTKMTDAEALAAVEQAAAALKYAGAKREGIDRVLAALAHLSSRLVAGEGWIAASVTPDVAKGCDKYFWVTVRRQDGKLYSFPATYANALPLLSEDARDNSGPGWSQRALSEDENDEGDIEITGWYDHKCDTSGEYDRVYQPVCSRGDELVAWMHGPAPCLATPPAHPQAADPILADFHGTDNPAKLAAAHKAFIYAEAPPAPKAGEGE